MHGMEAPMDLPGFHLSAYSQIDYALRPQIDHDLVGDLMSIAEDGGGGSAKKALRHLFNHLEAARVERDLTLSADLRRKVRAWEQIFVDGEKPASPPQCFTLDSDLAPSSYIGNFQ